MLMSWTALRWQHYTEKVKYDEQNNVPQNDPGIAKPNPSKNTTYMYMYCKQ
jgi:hypothetical protein